MNKTTKKLYIGRYDWNEPTQIEITTYLPDSPNYIAYCSQLVEVTYDIPNEAAQVRAQITQLKERQKQIKANCQQEIDNLDDKIQSLLAITLGD